MSRRDTIPPTANFSLAAFVLLAGLVFLLQISVSTTQAGQAAPQAAQASPSEEKILAPGLRYVHLKSTSPQGEPWSIHVLQMSRAQKSLELRTARGRGPAGEMIRERPTEMARREMAAGADVFAVVNGDYDIAAPYLGISDGTSITGGIISTTGQFTRPAFALRQNGEPLIGAPEVNIEASAGNAKWAWIDALNKPLGSAHSTHATQGFLRVFTADFRPKLERAAPFCAVTLNQVRPPLPLRVNQTVKARVAGVNASAISLSIGAQEIVLAKAGPRELPPTNSFCDQLRVGQRVDLRISIRVNGKSDVRDVIGGFPIIVQGGQRTIAGRPGANLRLRHPRTAVCTSKEKIIFVVVDGRQPQLSVGMTLEELGDLMVELGCDVALNTDGGGSSVMAVKMEVGDLKSEVGKNPLAAGDSKLAAPQPTRSVSDDALKIVNSPSDGQERGRGNAFLIVRKK